MFVFGSLYKKHTVFLREGIHRKHLMCNETIHVNSTCEKKIRDIERSMAK